MVLGEAAEKELYDAATIGDVAKFQQLLQQHPYLLHVVSFPYLKNVLHIAITEGQAHIVAEVLNVKPQLARDVDSKKSSSLHIAAAQGHVEIAKRLLVVAPEMCWWLDDQGMNPVHIAAMKGRVEILEELLQHDLYPAMERLHRGQTVMHLCVKHRQLATLKVLVEKMGELVYAKDDDGETLLHLAVRCNQLEVIQYLAGSDKVEKLTTNSMSNTALDILNESPQDTTTYSEIRKILIKLSNQSSARLLPKMKMTDTTMVVVVLIATMAFQATVSPPGGVWQDNTSSHRAGEAVMASTRPKTYKEFVLANNIAFISSLITIFLITIGGPFQSHFLFFITLDAMYISLIYIGASYGASLKMTNPMVTQSVWHIVVIVNSLCIGIAVLIIICCAIKIQYISWKKKKAQQQDLTAAPLTSLCLYQIFKVFDDLTIWLIDIFF